VFCEKLKLNHSLKALSMFRTNIGWKVFRDLRRRGASVDSCFKGLSVVLDAVRGHESIISCDVGYTCEPHLMREDFLDSSLLDEASTLHSHKHRPANAAATKAPRPDELNSEADEYRAEQLEQQIFATIAQNRSKSDTLDPAD
jgi:hypothetical protein